MRLRIQFSRSPSLSERHKALEMKLTVSETQQIYMRKGGKKINISSGILYSNHSLSANQTDWPLKGLTLNLLLKPLGESKGDELHNGYILAW